MGTPWPEDLYMDVKYSDLQIRFEATQICKEVVYPGHKFVLQYASPVFRAMLEGSNFKEGITGDIKLKVPGNENDVMAFHRFLYKKNLLQLEESSYLSLIQAGHLYQLSSLVETCKSRIIQGLTPGMACRIVDQIRDMQLSEISSACFQLILRAAFYIFDNQLHVCLGESTFGHILGCETLNVLDENQVAEALWTWGKARRPDDPGKEVKPLIHLVRWAHTCKICKGERWFEIAKINRARKKIKHDSRFCVIWPSLLSHAHFCKIKDVVEQIRYIQHVQAVDEWNLMVFSVHRDILLLGFVLQIVTTERLSKNRFLFSVMINNLNAKDLADLLNVLSLSCEER